MSCSPVEHDPLRSDPLEFPTLTGTSVRLRAFTAADVAAVQEASTDRAITQVTSVPATPSSRAALAFIARQDTRRHNGEGYSFAIADQSDTAVGQIGLWLRDPEHGRASVGYWIRPAARRRGYGAAALQTLVHWAPTVPQVTRLELYVEPWNEGSWRVAERAGFEREPWMLRRHDYGDDHRDMFMYSLQLDSTT